MSPSQTETGGCQVRSGLGITTAIHSRSTPFRDELASHSLQAVNAEIENRFHAFAYRCAWVVIEGDTATGYVFR